jgi:hypothetical protein
MMSEEKKQVTVKIVNHLRNEFIKKAQEFDLTGNRGISILTSFYTTLICDLLFDESDDIKMMLFMKDIKEALGRAGFKIFHGFEQVNPK